MPIVIEDLLIDTPPPETAAVDQARSVDTGQPATAWTAAFARRLDAELALAAERAERLLAD